MEQKAYFEKSKEIHLFNLIKIKKISTLLVIKKKKNELPIKIKTIFND